MSTSAAEKLPKNANLPPMLQQYLEYKENFPDCLLFFQVGDFFELFFEDATTVAKVINLTLTSRDKNNPDPVPMCGVPCSVIDSYSERLVSNGYSVAIVVQGELAPGTKGMVPRKLSRIITPGVRLLGSPENDSPEASVAALSFGSLDEFSLCFSAVQSGRIYVREGNGFDALVQEVGRISPSEIIIPRMIGGKILDRRSPWIRRIESIISGGAVKFRLEERGNAGRGALSSVSGYSQLSPVGKRSVTFLVEYIDEITVESSLQITSIIQRRYDDVVEVDATTRANLELLKNLKDGSTRGTLYGYLNHTATPGGARLLRDWISQPLAVLKPLNDRLNEVGGFVKAYDTTTALRDSLRGVPDIERIAARIELNIVTPRELAALRDALSLVPTIAAQLKKGVKTSTITFDSLTSLTKLEEELTQALHDVPPLSVNDGGIIRDGFNTELDEYRNLSKNGKDKLAELEAFERNRTGISSLKVKYNGVFGYFIEITNSNLAKAPADYTRKQTTAQGERFVTPQLKELEDALLGAEDKMIILEKRLFDELRTKAKDFTEPLRALSEKISSLDILLTFAWLSVRDNLVKPTVTDNVELTINRGRHPELARRLTGGFIPNSLSMTNEGTRSYIITGPNMGGKSTYLRQTALITLMAQIGCFVSADSATIGLVDKIFARLGASDDISEGDSTFMVEMREASHIIQNATERSLILIDEIGRGTATADGLSIAQAILEWIVTVTKCRTLFATHFHELTSLDALHRGLGNLSVGSVERDGNVHFTHEIHKGPASKSYGIEVAKLAGLPTELLNRAKDLLTGIASTPQPKKEKPSAQLSIFEFKPKTETEPKDYKELKALKAALQVIDPNSTTPLQALQILSDIHQRVKS